MVCEIVAENGKRMEGQQSSQVCDSGVNGVDDVLSDERVGAGLFYLSLTP